MYISGRATGLRAVTLLAVTVFSPGMSEVWRDCLQCMALCQSLPSAYPQQGLELRSETLIQPAVDKRVVASAAHGKPVESKIHGIVTADKFTGHQDEITVQWEPANGKDHHYKHQHFEGHLLLPPVGVVLFHGNVPNGIS